MNKKKIDLVILAGGKGSRIKEYLHGFPKPMLKFNNKYFLTYILNLTSKYDFNKIYILTGYRSKIIFKNFHNKTFNFIKVICVKENKEMGTGGALSLLKDKVNDFILLNGDTLFNIDYLKFINSLNKKKIGIVSLVKNLNQNSSKLNSLSLHKNLIKYKNNGKFMNGGVYFFKKEILKVIPKKKMFT